MNTKEIDATFSDWVKQPFNTLYFPSYTKRIGSREWFIGYDLDVTTDLKWNLSYTANAGPTYVGMFISPENAIGICNMLTKQAVY